MSPWGRCPTHSQKGKVLTASDLPDRHGCNGMLGMCYCHWTSSTARTAKLLGVTWADDYEGLINVMDEGHDDPVRAVPNICA